MKSIKVTHDIVLISGKMGSGKTTLSKAIAETLLRKPKWHCEQLTFAAPLYQMHDFCRNVLRQAGIEPPHQVKDGNLLQLLGTEWGRNTVDQNIWVRHMAGRITNRLMHEEDHAICDGNHIVFVISDCRFKNEFDAFPYALRVRLEAPREVRKTRAEMWRENENHPSEIDLDRHAELGLFDMDLNTAAGVSPKALSELIVAQLEKCSWMDKREEPHNDGKVQVLPASD